VTPDARREYEKALMDKGEIRERARRLREDACKDPSIRDAARLVAWFRYDRASVRHMGGEDLAFPGGWPPDSVDADNEVSALIDAWLPDLRELGGEDL
jgi:hypothetical protein